MPLARSRTHRRSRLVALMLALAVALAAAFAVAASAITPISPGPPDPNITSGRALTALNRARERWAQLDAGSYRMRVRVSCFCTEDVRRPRTIVVRNGKPVGSVPSHLRRYATVPRLHARIRGAIDARVARLTAEYNRFGVPTTIYVDQSEQIADEEQGVTVDRFSVLR